MAPRSLDHGGGTTAQRRRPGSAARQTVMHRERSSRACHRCKAKKLKCHFTGNEARICAFCAKAKADCVFDLAPDGTPRGASYIKALEERNALLESRLEDARNEALLQGSAVARDVEPSNTDLQADHPDTVENSAASTFVAFEDLTVFTLATHGPKVAATKCRLLPSLPPPGVADRLLQSCYQHTQAHVCIVDWVMLRRWHESRERVCFASSQDGLEVMKQAYFLWMSYAIGAQLDTCSDVPCTDYYARALQYLSAPLVREDLVAVQALLMLAQYSFRASAGASQWSIIGVALRLCIGLGLHRESRHTTSLDPYTAELEKRFFWCAYTFDRLVSLTSNRPFGINDLDIDAQYPLDVDVECTDHSELSALRLDKDRRLQASMTCSSMSSCLHLIEMLRLRSRIKTYFYGPHASPPSHSDVVRLMDELQQWRHGAPLTTQSPIKPGLSPRDLDLLHLQASHELCSPILRKAVIDREILKRCAKIAATGCESLKSLCLSPDHQISPVYNFLCFNFGATLLRCLVIDSDILSTSQILRAVSACTSALAVYTRALGPSIPYLQLFDLLCDSYFANTDKSSPLYARLCTTLHRLSFCGPEELSECIHQLSSGRLEHQVGPQLAAEAQIAGTVHGSEPHNIPTAETWSMVFSDEAAIPSISCMTDLLGF